MKRFQILLALLVLPLLTMAQKVKIDNSGMVSADGKPVFQMEGKVGMISTAISVLNLDGEVLLAADAAPGSDFLTVTFTGTNASLDYPMTIGLRKILAKDLVNLKVIKDGQLNPDGMKRFIAKYNGRADQSVVLTQSNTSGGIVIGEVLPVMVQRNRNSNIFINGNEIKQDFKTIGQVYSKRETSNGQVFFIYSFTDIDGKQVAETAKAMSSNIVEVRTYKNEVFSFSLPDSNINEIALKKMITERLIAEGLL